MVSSEVWHDNTWWEAALPTSWLFHRDQSIHAWPYVFEAPNGARLWIDASKHYESSEWDFSLAPPELTDEQKKAFVLTVSAASPTKPAASFQLTYFSTAIREHMDELTRRYNSKRASVASQLTRLDLGDLVGFTHPWVEHGVGGWLGYFSHDPWMLRVTFKAPAAVADECSGIAKSVIESIRFKGA